ncbi:MAG: hypothetical protein A2073_08475 [Deltaproteobacteria bacterium GWC2_42_11]|nr:MAG: hypothetical protein A2073_08475 [Deltaproteobacteria bacterium GWC2_42_11]HBO83544.1 hypothetical protein [Deltaproteobacteria bacterium]
MVGIIVVAHGELADMLISTAESITGRLEAVRGIAVNKGDTAEDIRKSISDAIKAVDSGMGVLILTDMFGGTPSNISLSFLEDGKVEVLTGVNLPMLLKLYSYLKGRTLSELAELLQTSGKESIVISSRMLKKE